MAPVAIGQANQPGIACSIRYRTFLFSDSPSFACPKTRNKTLREIP
jgi:hypothetical protein